MQEKKQKSLAIVPNIGIITAMTKVETKLKRCHRCKKWKGRSRFSRNRTQKDGLQLYCKQCVRDYRLKRVGAGRVKKYFTYEESHRIVDGVKEKRCYRCKKWKDRSRFSRSRKLKDGLCAICKQCARDYWRKKRAPGRVYRKYLTYEQRHRVGDGVKQKLCCGCKTWKAESEFSRNRSQKDGLCEQCKKCANKAFNKYRKKRLAIKKKG